jgi:hypothetical protein
MPSALAVLRLITISNFVTLFDWQIGGVGASQNFGESVEVADMSGPD